MGDATLRPVFIGACPRSGTTLLGSMLGVGPALLTVPEAVFKFTAIPPLLDREGRVVTRDAIERLANDPAFRRWGLKPRADDLGSRISAAELVEHLVGVFGRRSGKPHPQVWVDHTPGNIRFAPSLARMFPAARFVHLIRDGRAVAASVLPLDWGPNTIAEAAGWWGRHVAVGLAAERALGSERMLTVRYEDLVRDPRGTLETICAFAALPFDEAMIRQRDYDADAFSRTDQRRAGSPPDPSRAVAWRRRLDGGQVELFEHLTWELLDLLGYEMEYGATARMAPRRTRLLAFGHDVLRRGLTDRIRRRRRRGGLEAAGS